MSLQFSTPSDKAAHVPQIGNTGALAYPVHFPMPISYCLRGASSVSIMDRH